MSLMELGILEMHCFPYFSPSWFVIWSWNFVYDFLFMSYSTNQVECCSFGSIFVGVMPLSTNTENTQFSAIFLLHASIYWAIYKFYFINLRSSSSVVILRQFLCELCSFSNLNYWKYVHFSSTYFNILSWNFALDILFMNSGVHIKFVGRHFASISYELWTYFIIILKVQFYALFLCMLWEKTDILVKYFENITFLSFHDGRIMHRLWCLGIFIRWFRQTAPFSRLFWRIQRTYFRFKPPVSSRWCSFIERRGPKCLCQ